jgi:hypothetical protein
MDPQELSRISDDLAGGKAVEGWSGMRHQDREYLRSKVPNTLWCREYARGTWVVITSFEAETNRGRLIPRPDHPVLQLSSTRKSFFN